MNRDDYHLDVAAMNGRPQRLVSLARNDGHEFRDQVNADSASARNRFVRHAARKFEVQEQDFRWLEDAIVASADQADAQADLLVCEGDRQDRKSQATQLVEVCSNAELFHDAEGEAFARFHVGDHLEVAGIRAKRFRRWLAREFYVAVGKAPGAQAMQDAIGVLEGEAIFSGEQRDVHVRVAEHENCVYIDLCDDEWRVVVVTPTGWRVLDESPVMFRRAKAMLPLPTPVCGGSINELRQFVQLTDDDWALFLAWLVAALRPRGPYPILNVQGEHGSGKSTACKMARALVDPNSAMLRSEAREPRDLMIASKNGWVIAFDNLSGMQVWQSDCLCRLSTGGGFATRTLYENDEETIFDAQRPIIVNGIEAVGTRSDLLDRCLLLNVPRIDKSQRRPESELWPAFEEAQPRILGALLTAAATALANLPGVRLAALPRMADFALWATAAEQALDMPPGRFMDAYEASRATGNETALEATPVGKAVTEFLNYVGEWSGTASDLLEELERRADDKTKRLKGWPGSARSLGGAMKRIAPNLREAGVCVEFMRSGRKGTRIIDLRIEEQGAPADANGFGSWPADAEPQLTSSVEGALDPEGFGDADDADNADGQFATHSCEWD